MYTVQLCNCCFNGYKAFFCVSFYKDLLAFCFTQKLQIWHTPPSSLKAIPKYAKLIKPTHVTRSGFILVCNVNKVSLKDSRTHLAAHCGVTEALEGQEAPLAPSL